MAASLRAVVPRPPVAATPADAPLIDLQGIDWGVVLVNWGLGLLIALVGLWLAKWISRTLYRALGRAGMESTLAGFLRNVTYALLLLMVFISALQKIGVATTSLLAVLGAVGLAVGLAMRDSLSNIASGVMLIVLRPFRDGDHVQAAGVEGVVEEIRIFQTRMRTFDNRLIILPNSLITTAPIINFTAKPQRRIDIPVSVGDEEDLKHAREILLGLASSNALVLKTPEPFVLVSRLGERSIDLTLHAWAKTGDFAEARSQLTEGVRGAMRGDGLSLPSAQRELHVYHHNADGSLLTDIATRAITDDANRIPTTPAT